MICFNSAILRIPDIGTLVFSGGDYIITIINLLFLSIDAAE
jgi:hypothetical protein